MPAAIREPPRTDSMAQSELRDHTEYACGGRRDYVARALESVGFARKFIDEKLSVLN